MKDRLMESARDVAERAGTYAQSSVRRLSDRAPHVADVRRFVRERPLQAMPVTAAIGYVLGKILRRG